VLWDTAAGDWSTNDPQLIARRVLARVHGGSIVLLHDGLDGNAHANRTVILRAVPLILAGLRAKGKIVARRKELYQSQGSAEATNVGL